MDTPNKIKYTDLNKVNIIKFGETKESIVYKNTSEYTLSTFKNNYLNKNRVLILVVRYKDNTVVGEIVDLRNQLIQLNKVLELQNKVITKEICIDGTDKTDNIAYKNSSLIQADCEYNIGICDDIDSGFYFNGIRRANIIKDWHNVDSEFIRSKYKKAIFQAAMDLTDTEMLELKNEHNKIKALNSYKNYINRNKYTFYITINTLTYKMVLDDKKFKVRLDSKNEREEAQELRVLQSEVNRFKKSLIEWLTKDINNKQAEALKIKYNTFIGQSHVLPDYIMYAYKVKTYNIISTEASDYINKNNIECEIDKQTVIDIILNMNIISLQSASKPDTEMRTRSILPYYSGKVPRISVYGDYIDVEISLLSSYTSSFDEMQRLIAKDKINLVKLAIKLIEKRIEDRPIKDMAPLNFYRPARYKLLRDYTAIVTFELKIKSEDKEVDALDTIHK